MQITWFVSQAIQNHARCLGLARTSLAWDENWSDCVGRGCFVAVRWGGGGQRQVDAPSNVVCVLLNDFLTVYSRDDDTTGIHGQQYPSSVGEDLSVPKEAAFECAHNLCLVEDRKGCEVVWLMKRGIGIAQFNIIRLFLAQWYSAINGLYDSSLHTKCINMKLLTCMIFRLRRALLSIWLHHLQPQSAYKKPFHYINLHRAC